MDVQRYQFRFIGDCITEKVVDGPWVLFTDHEAALAAARDEGYEAGLRARWGEREDRAWNAALDAVLARNAMAAPWVAALRKTTPQPEPLTREEQNERWRQDYNTQARLRTETFEKVIEPAVDEGWFHEGTLYIRVTSDEWWACHKGYRKFADLLPGKPAVAGE